MNKFSITTVKLLAVIQIFTLTLLAACSTPVVAARESGLASPTPIPLTACHATGDPANPYEIITITNDISPVPVNGCPTGPVLLKDGKITICHATGDENKPYNEISVSVNGLNGHGEHADDIFPTSADGCPATSEGNGNGEPSTTVCHATGDAENPYEELVVNAAELKTHQGHPNDINPVPVNGCPEKRVVVNDGKITICHATSSATNPYNEITISVNGLNGHGKHEGDLIPAPEGGCPSVPVTPNPDKITICHATGSSKNPYVEITISVNGLNGHDKHERDIIPAPAGGCPK